MNPPPQSGSGGNSVSSGSGGNGVVTGSGGGGPGSGGSVGSGSGGAMVVDPVDAGADSAPMVVKVSCPDMNYSDKYTPGYSISSQATTAAMTALQSMSVAEKADQMRGTQPGQTIFAQPDNTSRGIKGFKFRDGPRGVCLEADQVGPNGYSTSFPVAMARGASFDLELEYKVGDAIGDETLASQHTMLLSPTVNILRHPFWGRAQEVYGEDSYALGRFGSAFTAGLQQYVPACAKHYAANNIERGRESDNAEMDDQTLREVYANHFGMIVQDGGVACLMASYNLVKGTKATQSKLLLTDILRGEFGFKGFVLSDWWAMPGGQSPAQGMRPIWAAQAVTAGMDMELPNNLNYSVLETLVQGGGLKESDINTATLRILQQKFRFNVATTNGNFGLKRPTTVNNNGSIGNDAVHLALAEEAAVKSMVLLKNANKTLPIDKTKVKTVAVLGLNVGYNLRTEGNGNVDFARDVRTGDRGSSRVKHDPAKAIGPLAGITAAAGAGVTVTTGQNAQAAANADFVVVVAGLTPQDEGEDYTGASDRGTFSLNGKANAPQIDLINAVAALGKPMAVVIEAGAVVDLPWLADSKVGAIVMAWYPGQRGGAALGKLLFGTANFSGKLPVTWSSRSGDWPTFNSGASTTMDYDLGYQYFDRKQTAPDSYLPFGHGLSYSQFSYSNLQVPCSDVTKKGVVEIKVDVTNNSDVEGDEVVFLFTSYPGSKARRHIKELKQFARVTVPAHKTVRVPISLRISDLKYYDMTSKSWQVESGMVQVAVGPSSRELPLKDTFLIK